MTGTSALSQREAYRLMPALNPGLGKPVCSKNPPGYSITSGCAAGLRGPQRKRIRHERAELIE